MKKDWIPFTILVSAILALSVIHTCRHYSGSMTVKQGEFHMQVGPAPESMAPSEPEPAEDISSKAECEEKVADELECPDGMTESECAEIGDAEPEVKEPCTP